MNPNTGSIQIKPDRQSGKTGITMNSESDDQGSNWKDTFIRHDI